MGVIPEKPMKILTAGTFDVPHYGHYRLLKRCAALGETWVGLNTDEFVTKYKGKPPIMTYKEREKVLVEWGYKVVPNDQADGTIKDIVDLVKPDMIVIGSEWGRRDYLKQIGVNFDYLDEHNISLLYVPFTHGITTTILKERLKND